LQEYQLAVSFSSHHYSDLLQQPDFAMHQEELKEDYRIIELFGLEGTFKGHPVQPPLQ